MKTRSEQNVSKRVVYAEHPLRRRLPSAVALEMPGTSGNPYDFTENDKDNLETYFVNLFEYNRWYKGNIDRKHSNILEIEAVRNLVKGVLQREEINLPNDLQFGFIGSTRPDASSKYIRFSIHSPVSIDVYDAVGNHTGVVFDPNNLDDAFFVEENIPNSSLLFFGEGKYVTLPADQEYQVELKGLDYGSFTFEIEEKLGDDVLTTKTMANIPVTPETTATMSIKTLAEATPLEIDVDGDAEIDVTLPVDGTQEDIDAADELTILFNLIGTVEMKEGLKSALLKKLLLAQNQLEKGKPDKAKKMLDNTIKRLEREIKRNERLSMIDQKHTTTQAKLQGKIDELKKQLEDEDQVDTLADAEDEKTFKELQKEAKKNEKLQRKLNKLELLLHKKSEKWVVWKEKHPGERIAPEDAKMLIVLLERIIEKLV